MFAIHAIDKSDNNKDSKSNNKKVDDVLEEIAIGNMGDSVGAENVRDVDRESGKIKTTSKETGDGHDHIVYERFDNSSKSATNGNTDGEINDITTVDELAELFHKSAFGNFFDGDNRFISHNKAIITYL